MWLSILLDRGAIISSGKDSVGCLAAKHVLCGLGSVARLGRLGAVRVVSRERMGVLLGYGVLGDAARLEHGSIGKGVCMGGGGGDVVGVGAVGAVAVVGQRGGKLRRRGLRGILPNHSHSGGEEEPLEGLKERGPGCQSSLSDSWRIEQGKGRVVGGRPRPLSTAQPAATGAYAFAKSSPVCCDGHFFWDWLGFFSTGCPRTGTVPAETPAECWREVVAVADVAHSRTCRSRTARLCRASGAARGRRWQQMVAVGSGVRSARDGRGLCGKEAVGVSARAGPWT